ncbi:MAG: amidohydrolase family protein [Gemmatimonas sp.]|nr:amidohydrolase family protein [Gemmatimonas sp.]
MTMVFLQPSALTTSLDPSNPSWASRAWLRARIHGKVWGANQSITVAEAIRCGTINGAHCLFMENDLGSITAGMLADFVLFAEDPHTTDPDRIKEIRVVRTVVGGNTVHEA